MKENIYLYYTNDLHSDFTYWPQVVYYFNKAREKRMQRNEAHFLVDIGDHVDRVHPIAEASMGKANVDLLNEAKYDLVTLGNNEGITLSHHDLFHLYDHANFDVVCSNLYSRTEKEPDWLERIVYKQTDSKLRVAFLGLTAAFNPFYHLLQWHIADPMESLKLQVEEAAKHADIIVLLSHVGLHRDEQIAEYFPEIDLIIGGHTHHLLKEGEMVRNTLLTAAGKHGAHVGEVILTYDHGRKKLSKKQAYTTNITRGKEDIQTTTKLNQMLEEASDKLSSLVARTNRTLKVDWYAETEIMTMLTARLKGWTKADVAMLNAGLLLEDLPKGRITHKDVHRICPHPINPVLVEVTGRELKEIIRVGQTEEFMNFKLKGFGFRGNKIGALIFSGLSYIGDKTSLQSSMNQLRINEELIDDYKIYSLATADMFIFGRLLPEVAKSKRKDLFLPEFIRDILASSLQKEFK